MTLECDASDVIKLAAIVSEHLSVFDQLSFLLRLQIAWHERSLVTVEPLSYASRLMLHPPPRNCLRLSRFAFLQRHEDGLALESAVAAHRVVLHDGWGASLVSLLARGGLPAGDPKVVDEAAPVVISLLSATGMLDGSEQASPAGFGEELLQMGEFHDLLFHRRSRFGRHDGSFGAEFPYLDKIAPGPAIARSLADTIIPLPVPREQDVSERDLTLTQAIERRASGRHYSAEPLTVAQLGEFLFRCARVRAQYGPAPEARMPYEASDRPYPSGGAIHDLELYLIVSRVQDLPVGAYRYAADKHALEKLPAREQAIAILLQSAMQASAATDPPHVLFKITSRFGRMSWKYRSISYATTLKNVGVLYQTMYLVATAMGLAACALGSGDDVAGEDALNLSARSEIAVGEFMLGKPPMSAEGGNHPRPRRIDPTWRPLVEPTWGRE
jgi:SagB-type dehydrogenase family enzyme